MRLQLFWCFQNIVKQFQNLKKLPVCQVFNWFPSSYAAESKKGFWGICCWKSVMIPDQLYVCVNSFAIRQLSKKASHSCILRFWLADAPNQTKPSNLNWLWQKLWEGGRAVLSLGSWYHSKVLCPLNACDIFAKSMWQSDDTKCDINVTSMLHCDIHATSVTSLRSPHDANVTPFPSELCSWGRFNSSYFNFNNAFHMYFLYCEFYIIQTNIFH